MAIGNIFIRWIVIALLAYIYGGLVQHVLGYDRGRVLLTLSIGALGIIIGKYILPMPFNLHEIFHLGGIPLISSLIGSFIIPGIMWFLRKENSIFNNTKND